MDSTLKNIVIGFIAAALAVLIFHQGMLLLIGQMGWSKGTPWNLTPVGPYGVPKLLNQMFWGGLYGALFGLIAEQLPGGSYPVRGFIFGLIFTTILGSWLIVSLIKGRPVFRGFFESFDITRLRNGFLLNSVAFGIGLGLLYQLMNGRRSSEPD